MLLKARSVQGQSSLQGSQRLDHTNALICSIALIAKTVDVDLQCPETFLALKPCISQHDILQSMNSLLLLLFESLLLDDICHVLLVSNFFDSCFLEIIDLLRQIGEFEEIERLEGYRTYESCFGVLKYLSMLSIFVEMKVGRTRTTSSLRPTICPGAIKLKRMVA